VLFPFVAKPIFQSIYGMDESEYNDFIEERKETVPQLIRQTLS
jgi:hypothetical protein